MRIEELELVLVVSIAEEDFIWRSSHNHESDGLINAQELSYFCIILWPHHFNFVFFQNVSRNVFRRIYGLYYLSQKQRITILDFLFFWQINRPDWDTVWCSPDNSLSPFLNRTLVNRRLCQREEKTEKPLNIKKASRKN